jgi:hypothetical protein
VAVQTFVSVHLLAVLAAMAVVVLDRTMLVVLLGLVMEFQILAVAEVGLHQAELEPISQQVAVDLV